MKHVSFFCSAEGPPGGCVYSIKGERESMEDESVYATWRVGAKKVEFFGVFDGHGGKDASLKARKTLPLLVAATLKSFRRNEVIKSLECAFCLFQSILQQDPQRYDYQGTTAATVLRLGNTVYVANIGDSRVVLCRRRSALALTRDHKPNTREESARIKSLGGWIDTSGSVARVGDVGLSTSRSFGDLDSRFIYKDGKRVSLPPGQYLVSPRPDVAVVNLQVDDKFLLLACDGVWDVMRNAEACRVVLEDGCVGLVRKAHAKGSTDNITVMVYPLVGGVVGDMVNPRTGRPIKRGGQTHRKLQRAGVLQ